MSFLMRRRCFFRPRCNPNLWRFRDGRMGDVRRVERRLAYRFMLTESGDAVAKLDRDQRSRSAVGMAGGLLLLNSGDNEVPRTCDARWNSDGQFKELHGLGTPWYRAHRKFLPTAYDAQDHDSARPKSRSLSLSSFSCPIWHVVLSDRCVAESPCWARFAKKIPWDTLLRNWEIHEVV